MSDQPTSSTVKVARTAAAGGAVLSLGAALVGPVAPADAAEFSVTTAADSGAGSLRQAIADANAAAGADTITFAPGLGAITLASEIVIDDPLEITGPATVSGGDATRIFNINGAEAVTITGLTLQNGSATDGGAVLSNGTQLTVQQTTIANSEATSGTGGGLKVNGTDLIEIVDSTITGNTASSEGGGAYFHTDDEQLIISGSTFSGNTAGSGGGGFASTHIYDVSIDTTTVSGNTADGDGGGIYIHQHSETSVTITSSTISGNHATGDGGGMRVYDEGYLDISHTTIAGNTADGNGGGAYLGGTYEATLSHVLIANNSATAGADLDGDSNEAPLAVSFSLIEAAVEPGLIDDVEGNILGEDPMLAALAPNGGPNQTQALQAGSPALDGGDPAFAPPPATDQRGLPRVQGAAIDIGAYETQPADPVDPGGSGRPHRAARGPAGRGQPPLHRLSHLGVGLRSGPSASADSTNEPDTSSAPGSTISGQRRPRSNCTS